MVNFLLYLYLTNTLTPTCMDGIVTSLFMHSFTHCLIIVLKTFIDCNRSSFMRNTIQRCCFLFFVVVSIICLRRFALCMAGKIWCIDDVFFLLTLFSLKINLRHMKFALAEICWESKFSFLEEWAIPNKPLQLLLIN